MNIWHNEKIDAPCNTFKMRLMSRNDCGFAGVNTQLSNKLVIFLIFAHDATSKSCTAKGMQNSTLTICSCINSNSRNTSSLSCVHVK